jgi:hypothetical protein
MDLRQPINSCHLDLDLDLLDMIKQLQPKRTSALIQSEENRHRNERHKDGDNRKHGQQKHK